jgi:hypothetical protein
VSKRAWTQAQFRAIINGMRGHGAARSEDNKAVTVGPKPTELRAYGFTRLYLSPLHPQKLITDPCLLALPIGSQAKRLSSLVSTT